MHFVHFNTHLYKADVVAVTTQMH